MILIFFIGIAFYMLAWKYGKNKLLYIIIGILTAFVAQFVVGLGYGIILRPTKTEIENSEMLVSVVAAAFSILVVVVIYTILEKKFKKNSEQINDVTDNFEKVTDSNI